MLPRLPPAHAKWPFATAPATLPRLPGPTVAVTTSAYAAQLSKVHPSLGPVTGRGPLKVELQDGRAFDAEILAVDRERDLAALSIAADGLPTIQLTDSRAARPGQWVMAIGHPYGVVGSATGGVVIGMGRQWPEMSPAKRDWIVVGLHMRPGHSGGPLVDARGRLLGINTMINGPDVGFAIPTHVVVEFLKGMVGR